MTDPLEHAPPTLHRTDERAVREAASWVQGGHPQECWRRLYAALNRSSEHLTLQGVILAHIIEQHTPEVMQLSELARPPIPYGHAEVGLDRAIELRGAELTDLLLSEWGDLATAPSGPWLANLIAARVALDSFRRLWARAWHKPSATSIALLKELLWAANAQPGFAAERASFLDERLTDLVDLVGLEPPLRYVARANLDETLRERLLHMLLDIHGVAAARLLADPNRRPIKPTLASARAYYTLKSDDPHGELTQKALAGALEVDLDGLSGDLARLVNDDGAKIAGSWFSIVDELRWATSSAMTPSLLSVIGEDALTRNAPRHGALAAHVHSLRVHPELVAAWLRDTIELNRALGYNAVLLRLYLSDHRIEESAKEQLADLAEDLFRRHSNVERERVLGQWNVKDASRVYQAIALTRELSDPSPPPDIAAIEENLRRYPETLSALGGESFGPWLRRCPTDFVVALWYEERPEHTYESLSKSPPQGLEDIRTIAARHRRLEDVLCFRVQWEHRLRLLRRRGINFQLDRLRRSRDAWIEAIVGSRLLEDGFQVCYEPKDEFTDGPHLDFLVQDPTTGQSFFLEILRIGQRPDEVLDAAKVSFGGEPKKSLQNKLRKQLRDGALDPRRPLVIGLQVRSPFDLAYSLPNSLYGPLHVGWETGEDDTLAEGLYRNSDAGLFSEDKARFVSGVLAFTQEAPGAAFLTGRMFWPMTRPPHPLPRPLYVRLRNTLFGERPANDVDRMSRIPTITRDEAETLVQHGLDSPSLLVSEQFDYQNLPVPRQRVEELARELQWLKVLQERGQVQLLKAARGIDLTPLSEAGIHTLQQLLRSDRCPEGLPEGIWQALRAEAAMWTR